MLQEIFLFWATLITNSLKKIYQTFYIQDIYYINCNIFGFDEYPKNMSNWIILRHIVLEGLKKPSSQYPGKLHHFSSF